MSLQLMKSRIAQSGATLREEQVKDAQETLSFGFDDDVSYVGDAFYWIPGESPRKGEQLDIKLYDKKYSGANGLTQKFLTKHTDVVEVGDYVYIDSDNTYWICTESFNVAGVHYEGRLAQCNWRLKWQKPDGTILEYPCQDMNATQYNSGEAGNKYMMLGSSQHMELVQATEDTLALASPQRFYIDKGNKIPYIVTQNDSTARNYGKGLCQITVMQDVIRDNDRPDLGICDYFVISPSDEDDNETIVLSGGVSGIISGSKTIKVGFGRTYTASIVGDDGREVEWSDKFSWNVVDSLGVVSSVDGNKMFMSVSDEKYIGSVIVLQIVDNNASVIAQTEITVIDIL